MLFCKKPVFKTQDSKETETALFQNLSYFLYKKRENFQILQIKKLARIFWGKGKFKKLKLYPNPKILIKNVHLGVFDKVGVYLCVAEWGRVLLVASNTSSTIVLQHSSIGT